jgi:pimeloyl-ACP methyl ester carboxylesterase
VDLLGHSYGGNVAFGAATLTPHVRRLVLYEGWPVPNVAHRTVAPETMARLETWLAEGERERVLETFYREVAGVTAEELVQVRSAPTWPARVAAAHTIPREIRAFGEQAFDPAQAARITVPVLLLVGSESTEAGQADPEVVAAALPDARIRVLDGQAHLAHLGDPDGFSAALLAFLRD